MNNMAVIQQGARGRDFTAEELTGRQIRIEGPVPKKNGLPNGNTIRIVADDEEVGNAFKAIISLGAGELTEATIWLYRFDSVKPDGPCPVEKVTLRDNIELSFSAYISEVQ
jgi:hypothetical protein